MINITTWFTGIVEDISDPSGQKRVRVRIFGLHNTNKTILPTEDLPWSQVIMPPGTSWGSSEVIALNSWVFGFFRDGDEKQDAVILGLFNSSISSHGFINSDITSYGANLAPASGLSTVLSPNVDNNVFNFSSGVISSSNAGAYVPNTTFNGSGSLVDGFNASKPSPGQLLAVNQNNAARIVAAAQSELNAGVVETSKNQGPGIEKYWSATSYASGYRDRQPWCAAFGCWIIKQSGVLPENIRPKTASAFGFREWAQTTGRDYCRLTLNPRTISAGDIIVYSHSHLAIATENSIENRVSVIDGNGSGNRVAAKQGKVSNVAFSITII